MEKQEKREKKILTENRMTTVNKRETSFEGLASSMENGEDGIYSLITENKNVIFQPKVSITQQDLDTIPMLKQLRDTINVWEQALKRTSGTKQAYTIKKALIEMRRDQYLIKQAYTRPIIMHKLSHSSRPIIPLEDNSILNGQEVEVKGISFMSPEVVAAILTNYSKLKEDSWGVFDTDTWYLMESFDDLASRALSAFPIFERIVELKVDKKQNVEIQTILKEEFDTTYSIEYLSHLWCNKIPKLIAKQALEDFLTDEYIKRNYPMKKCTKCGQLKPAHNQFFSKNNTSKDNLYSICKCCRSKKRG